MARTIIRKKNRKVCVGDMSSRVKLQSRDITEPAFGDTNFDENFVGTSEVWAVVNTTAGKVIFNGVNADVAISHAIFIRHDPSVTAETWVELEDGTRLDVVNVESLDERGDIMRLFCTERGDKTKGATAA